MPIQHKYTRNVFGYYSKKCFFFKYFTFISFFLTDHTSIMKIINSKKIDSIPMWALTPTTKEECPICIKELNEVSAVAKMTCGHPFCHNCIQEWIDCGHRTCPICRANIDLSGCPNKTIIVLNESDFEYDDTNAED